MEKMLQRREESSADRFLALSDHRQAGRDAGGTREEQERGAGGRGVWARTQWRSGPQLATSGGWGRARRSN